MAQPSNIVNAIQQAHATRTVGAGVTRSKRSWQPGMPLLENALEFCKVGVWHVAARQRFIRGPVRVHIAEQRLQMLHRLFRQAPVGGDLAAENRQHRCLTLLGLQLKAVITRDGGRVGDFLFQQRPHAGICPDHLCRGYRDFEIAVHRLAQVSDFLFRYLNLARIAAVLDIGSADQREISFIWNRKDDALVRVLKNVRVIVIEQTFGSDVASLDQTNMVLRRGMQGAVQQAGYPGSGGVDHTTRLGFSRLASQGRLQSGVPVLTASLGFDQAGLGENRRAALVGIHRIEHHQPRILHRRIGIHEALGQCLFQRLARDMLAEIDGA